MTVETPKSEIACVALDHDVADALDGLAELLDMSRERAASYAIREYLTALGALDYQALEDDMVTVGNA